ncbi:MAG: hypothetical protein JGK08_01070 [Microcoleus sp. PH2017_04_SCI_O_A]|uniref:hypothetical protein n=1 Tax=Microcoleus sp. PH2017_15_JOR_U_A TaxID=2798826 RepID=UPI001D2460E3|nr:hypothetical protein [Microcoleus sp. PH2017_15_JOR_U_A]MCC3428696.1 hypothetical protein [Microcoleus sp. PH2017_04_SCI_O_A]
MVESPPACSGEIKIRLFITPILGLKGRGRSPSVNGQLSTVNCQLSTVNCQLSTVELHACVGRSTMFDRQSRGCRSTVSNNF